jgi:hypothetical protein
MPRLPEGPDGMSRSAFKLSEEKMHRGEGTKGEGAGCKGGKASSKISWYRQVCSRSYVRADYLCRVSYPNLIAICYLLLDLVFRPTRFAI